MDQPDRVAFVSLGELTSGLERADINLKSREGFFCYVDWSSRAEPLHEIPCDNLFTDSDPLKPSYLKNGTVRVDVHHNAGSRVVTDFHVL